MTDVDNIVARREGCRICSRNNPELALKLTPTPLADEYVSEEYLTKNQIVLPLNAHLCDRCGLFQLLDIVNPKNVYIDYIYKTSSSLGLNKHFEEYSEQVIGNLDLKKNSLVIDIGSNEGSLLYSFKTKGLRVLGIDPAKDIAKEATENGIETLPIFFDFNTSEEIKRKYGKASVITCNNLFANIDELHDFVKGVKNLLSDEGVFIVEASYLEDTVGNMIFDYIYHEHLSYFSLKPLAFLFNQHDMEYLKVERIESKGGSFRSYFKLKSSVREIDPSVENLRENEINIKLHDIATFKDFDAAINTVKKDVLDKLHTLKQNGQKIAAYGASATSTTLIYHFGLGDYIDFLVDENNAKIGTYSPGLHIPVLDPSTIYQKNPDYVIVLAWRYAKTIINKHTGYFNRGGKFILPLPDLKIVENTNQLVNL